MLGLAAGKGRVDQPDQLLRRLCRQLHRDPRVRALRLIHEINGGGMVQGRVEGELRSQGKKGILGIGADSP